MVSGGARLQSGPPPDPKALARERDAADWTVLPAQGRAGDPPPWPLPEQSEREAFWWGRLWSKPQAVQWEKLGQVDEVAVYVRRLVVAEQPGAPVNVGTLLRQLGDALGLTIPGMLRLKWHLSAPARPDSGTEPAAAPPPAASSSSRGRFKVIRGDAAGA